MRWILTLASVVVLGFTLAFPTAAIACACCAEPGYRVDDERKIAPADKAELERIRFAKAAQLYHDQSEEPVKGLRDPSLAYELLVSSKGSRWTLTFRGENGKSGTLTFVLPRKLHRFYVDRRTGSPDLGTPLYKEWRLSAPVSGTGIFKQGMGKRSTIQLVFQGMGNRCHDAEMFTHWTLVVKGPAADYSLYGALAKPRA